LIGQAPPLKDQRYFVWCSGGAVLQEILNQHANASS
jgi:hypothetical protein